MSLSLVATAGLALATGEGASLDLIPVIVGVFVITLAIGALFIYERPLAFVVTWGIRVSRKLVGRPRGDVAANIERIVELVTAVRLGPRQIVRILLWGCANWLFDCGCFAMMFLAVDSSIPWKGLLLAYGAGQLAANLPFTPGGWAWWRGASPSRWWTSAAPRIRRSMPCSCTASSVSGWSWSWAGCSGASWRTRCAKGAGPGTRSHAPVEAELRADDGTGLPPAVRVDAAPVVER